MKNAIRVSIFAMIIFCLMSYGGIRSPDGEVVFRTTEALAVNGTFAVSGDLSWKGFGLYKGKDGKRYSLFGPAQAIAAVPLYQIARLINMTGWFQKGHSFVGISHYINGGLLDFVKDRTPGRFEPHALRTVVSLFNVIVGSMCVFVFFFLIKALTQSEQSALLTSILFAFGTLIFPYSGTFFSELLAIFFVMSSLYLLVHRSIVKKRTASAAYKDIVLAASGLALGLAAAVHITAVLFAPFFCIYAAFSGPKDDNPHPPMKRILRNGALFCIGLGLILALIAYYNYIRFDDIFETGRTINVQIESQRTYGRFVAPWRGLWGLLFSSGKGLFFYCPAILLGFIFWLPFHRKYRLLSFMILGTVFLRIVFIASRSDWHGGFCIGPRYMLMIIPFLLLPVGERVAKIITYGKNKSLLGFAVFSIFCIAQQIYFSLGEIFSYSHVIKWRGMEIGLDVFKGDYLYLNWDVSPLLYLLNGFRGPLLLKWVGAGNYTLWSWLVLAAGLLLPLVYFFTLKKNLTEPPSNHLCK